MKEKYTLSVQNADGPIQLCLMDEDLGHGLRLLGSKGSPYKEEIASWILTKEQLRSLIKDMTSVLRAKP